MKYYEIVECGDAEIAAANNCEVGTWIGRVYTQESNDVKVDIYAGDEAEVRADIDGAMKE